MADREYFNGEIVVLWRPLLCTHCEACWRGLPEVFNPKSKPWVDVSRATTEAIEKQISECPSGALASERRSLAFVVGEQVRVIGGCNNGKAGKVAWITPHEILPFHVVLEPTFDLRNATPFAANELLSESGLNTDKTV